MSEKTAARLAYEAFADQFPGESWGPWEKVSDLPMGERDGWEKVAQAAQKPLRDGITELLGSVTASANATRPSKKTSIEDEVAIALRKLLET